MKKILPGVASILSLGGAQILLLGGALGLMSCTAPSMQQVDARDREVEYRSAYEQYTEVEKEYLTLLMNLEIYPADDYLLMQKQLKRKEMEQLRTLMLQARVEFDSALLQWDDYVRGLRSLPRDTAALRPGEPSSPGHLVEKPLFPR